MTKNVFDVAGDIVTIRFSCPEIQGEVEIFPSDMIRKENKIIIDCPLCSKFHTLRNFD